MEHPIAQDVSAARWDVVAAKLDLLLHSFPSPVTPFDGIRNAWADIPLGLVERGLILRGVPSICIPAPDRYVQDDKVDEELFMWSYERLQALDKALGDQTLAVVQREPLALRAIFEFIDADGNHQDSTLGFSEDWQLRNMFKEEIYLARTSAQLRTMNVDSLLPILRSANLTTTHIPWASLPSKLWSSNQYMSAVPRICLPTVDGDKVPSDAPSPSTNWRKEQRVALQRCLDSGLLRILPRPSERIIIFEVLEADGSLSDTDCGLSDKWKLDHAFLPGKEKKAAKRRAARASQAKAPAPIPSMPWPQFHQSESYQKRMDVVENYMRLLRGQGLLLDSPEGPAWVYVPQMLATKRLYVSGLPRNCLPLVRDDDVVANYDPQQWNDATQDAFIRVLGGGQLQILPTPRGERVLYKALEMSGELKSDVLGFSDRWCKENIDPPDYSTISPSAYNIEMWLDMLERFGIPCHDLRGRRRIQWLQLPLILARRRLYISGCPVECLPKAEDDVVLELSSPYFYDHRQVALMYQAFTAKQVSIRPRSHHRNVLFSLETEAGSVDFTCGFTSLWIQMNLQTIPSAIATSSKSSGATKSVAFAPPPASINPVGIPLPPAGTTPPSSYVQRNAARHQNPYGYLTSRTAYPTPTDSAPASPISLNSVTSQPKVTHEPSPSLKIIIPAFKRRHLLTNVTSSSSSSSQSSHQDSRPSSAPLASSSTQPQQGPQVAPVLPDTSVPVAVFSTPLIMHSQSAPAVSRHMLPSRRPVIPILQNSPRRQKQQSIDSPSTSDTEDFPGAFGLRASMSPQLPPQNTLPSPLPSVPVPTFLPKPGGNLKWDDERAAWELTISEMWPPDEWKKILPVFPARLLWNAVQKVWMCEPSKLLTPPVASPAGVGLSPSVRAALQASTRDETDPIEEGLCIIWHRWRRSWGLFEYIPPVSSLVIS